MNNGGKYLKKLLIITDVTNEGGTNTYIYNVLRIVKEHRNYDISLLLDDNEHMNSMAEKCYLLGVNVIKKRIYHGTNSETDIRTAIVEVLQEVFPDIVHVFCGSIRSAICIRETVIDYNVPLFSTETYVAEGYPITNEELMRVKKIYNNTVKVTTVCDSNIRVLRECFGIHTDNISCIPTSCDMKDARFKRRKIEKDIYAVVIARLTKQKGLDILIEAFDLLDSKYQTKYQIDIIGEGELKKTLETLVEKLDLKDYFHFIGWKDNVFEEIGKYNLGIIPSRNEGLPNVEIEMIKLGLPLIISDVEGLLEATNHGEYVEVFKNESALELRDSLIDIIKTPDVIMNKSENAFTYVKKHYDMNINYLKYLDIWESEINKIGNCKS